VTAYNYEHFDAYVESGQDEREFGAFPNLLHAGERAPRRRTDPARRRARTALRAVAGAGLVLEFGSFT
jgi:hypothetical protein